MRDTHKAWRLHAYDDLRFDDVETPKPAADGVLVRVEAGMVLSYTDRVLSGEVPYSLPPMPFVPGTNAIGQVIAAGDNVVRLLPPLIIGDAEVLDAVERLDRACEAMEATLRTPLQGAAA